MFRLNGDVIKQLEEIYSFRFNLKFKNELKNRIISFVDSILLEQRFSVANLKQLKALITIENNEPYQLTPLFFNQYKEALFNSFNPLWYSEIDKKDKFYFFIEEAFDSIKNKFKADEEYQLNFNVNLDKFFKKEFEHLSFFKNNKFQKASQTNIDNFIFYLKDSIISEINYQFPSGIDINLEMKNLNKIYIYNRYNLLNHSLISENIDFPIIFNENTYFLFKRKNSLEFEKIPNNIVDNRYTCSFLFNLQLRACIYQELFIILNKYIEEKGFDLNNI